MQAAAPPLAEADAGLQVLCKRLAPAYPETNANIRRFFAEPLQDTYPQGARQGLIVLMAAVGFIRLIACANIANLLLARATCRQREIDVRIVRQMLTESALLAAGGGLLGVLLGEWCFNFLKNLIRRDLSRTVSLVSIPACWLSPWRPRQRRQHSVRYGSSFANIPHRFGWRAEAEEGGRGSAGPRRGMFGKLLVIGEVALSLMLLVGSGLVLKSFARLRGLNPGFRADHVLTVRVDAPLTKYADFTERSEFFERVLGRVRTLPGVQAAGFTSALPLTWDGGTGGFAPEGVAPRPDLIWDANNRVVTPGYFEAMRIPLRRGRLSGMPTGRMRRRQPSSTTPWSASPGRISSGTGHGTDRYRCRCGLSGRARPFPFAGQSAVRHQCLCRCRRHIRHRRAGGLLLPRAARIPCGPHHHGTL
jgi:putative ABC transport system permease protein